ncbi:MAG: O-methyltransferase [Bacteroidales bacterium]|nr:O-methyltransferase [Bacteroidales bacterium]
MESPLNKYLREHSTCPGPALDWIEKQTNIHTNYPRMLSGSVQGELLKLLVEISGARKILEIGSFTGYSAVCMALGMPSDGHIDALEINDELEPLMREGWEKAGVSDRITLHIGDAKETLAGLDGPYDFVFIDANKREYPDYFSAVVDKVRPGGLIVADDVLWDGKVYAEPLPADAQTAGLLKFNDMVADYPGVEVVVLPLRDGISIIRKK